LGKVITLEVSGYRNANDSDQLYFALDRKQEAVQFKAIPYFIWGNRGVGEMRIWLRF
jgi:DUF1680 family protein